MNSKHRKITLPLLITSFVLGGCATIPIEELSATEAQSQLRITIVADEQAPTLDGSSNDSVKWDSGTGESAATKPVPVTETKKAQFNISVPVLSSNTKSNLEGSAGVDSGLSEQPKTSLRYQFVEDSAGEVIFIEQTNRSDVELHYSDSVSYLVMIRPDDYLGKIALREYNNLAQWRNIYRWNKEIIGDDPNLLHPYHELELFKPEREIADWSYVYIIHAVAQGETLWSIAKDWYGDNLAWATIYADNEQLFVSSKGHLLRGMELKIRTNLLKLSLEDLRMSGMDIR